VVRGLEGIYGWCAACDRAVLVELFNDPLADDVMFRARCHGGTEMVAIDARDVRAALVPADIPKLVTWARRLFPADGNPDVRELLRYNREPWRSA
jgi:hypothetical protein